MATFNDQFSRQAKSYAKFRPEYPRELFEFLATLAPARELAWDCATGNGQAARGLAPFFKAVDATDASAEQISNAEPIKGVRFRVAPAESSGLGDQSVDLVTVALAVHWLDLDRFYAELRRVLKPRGIIAFWGYNSWETSTVPASITAIVARYTREIVGPYFAKELKRLWNGYRELPFPFTDVPAPPFSISNAWTMEELLGFLGTWSATQNFLAKNGSDPRDQIRDELAKAWEVLADGKIQLEWKLDLRLGRV